MSERMGEKIKPTQAELKRIEECMKNEDFRKELFAYMEAQNDPKVRAEEEAYLRQIEEESQYQVKFVFPKPGFCVRVMTHSREKVYINICQSTDVDPPIDPNVPKGVNAMWSVPNLIGKPREWIGKGNKTYTVYDVCYHPRAIQICNDSTMFTEMIVEIAIEAVNNSYNANLRMPDQERFKRKSEPSKGQPAAMQTRGAKIEGDMPQIAGMGNSNPNFQTFNMMGNRPTAASSSSSTSTPKPKPKATPKPKAAAKPKAKPKRIPKYTVLHRGEIDLADFVQGGKDTSRRLPKELVARIELPDMDSAAGLDLDLLSSTRLTLEHAKLNYFLDLTLPFPVDEEKYSCKFVKSSHQLVLTLRVVPPKNKIIEEVTAQVKRDEETFKREAHEQQKEEEREEQRVDEIKQELKRLVVQEERQRGKLENEEDSAREKLGLVADREADEIQEELRAIRMRERIARNQRERQEQEAKAKAAEEKQKAELEKRMQKERAAAALEAKMQERETRIPLKNQFIFALD
eukprot:TRINITY_DN54981_c0_g1_i1.p2 TRINITY_DN54981_c0_g1~~TRINITY_DN54981_c0_g1_i1.p2  ORF type:complete len:516 (+),score=84.98 TRINITY_DN54981_c0_g1_i1:62-1609(+)